MEIDQNEVEVRKQAELERLLAKGWRREDLTWFPPHGTPTPRPAELPMTAACTTTRPRRRPSERRWSL